MFIDRVLFENCKMIGVSFVDATLKDVEFGGCIAKYMNLSGAKLNNIIINSSDFNESTFLETSVKDVEFSKVDFSNSEFIKTSLNDIDFTDCDITGAYFDLKSLNKIKINSFQCQDIVRTLGVIVED